MKEELIPFMEFAYKCHFPQEYDSEPYTYHLHQVLGVAQSFSKYYPELRDLHFQQACIGHDLLEDTACTERILKNNGFDDRAIDLIKKVTDEPGKNRKERKLKTYPKIKGHYLATALKLCDRIANVRHCVYVNNRLFDMYMKERVEFEQNLRIDGQLTKLWGYLDHLYDYDKGLQLDGAG